MLSDSSDSSKTDMNNAETKIKPSQSKGKKKVSIDIGQVDNKSGLMASFNDKYDGNELALDEGVVNLKMKKVYTENRKPSKLASLDPSQMGPL